LDSKKLNDWLQVAGLFGVLAGLVFVGLQLSLDRQVAAVSGTEASTARAQHWAELVNANADVWFKGLAGEPLSEIESGRFSALAFSRQLNFFNNFNRASRGLAGTEPQRWVLDFAIELYENPGFRRWWVEFKRRAEARNERLGNPDGGWIALVDDELSRLQAVGSRQ
jgi:hypothetical protein